ncbi:hypothetical protein BCR43DRAFT_509739 [Syncephalastrum racemosum]|uniref:BZIP domain-containing protein n=1 Tax=Syncephalastrum racemosum TaxID=13706 RepID=A0A1X2HSM5_SYNRA|nr:hypothetical protein BCR43DRAFT_509739 [Syncephalastrum racemosum]
MTEISFEHFDPELELGNLDENGRPIRPRKKPGRKPNPPSPAQRKAQNRAAQRAFRERKRREMREAEATVKRCLYARDEALREANNLRRKVDELQYENNYLKGYVLTLKLACNANRVDVPNFWDTGAKDHLGAEKFLFSKSKNIPQTLEFFLDKNLHIVSLEEENIPADLVPDTPSSTADTASPSLPSAVQSSLSNLSLSSTAAVAAAHAASVSSGAPAMPGGLPDFDMSEDIPPPLPPLDLTQTVSVLAPQLQALSSTTQQIDPAFVQHLFHTDVVSGFLDQVTRPNFTIDQTPPELSALIPPEWRSSLQHFSTLRSDASQQTKQPMDVDGDDEEGSYVKSEPYAKDSAMWHNPLTAPHQEGQSVPLWTRNPDGSKTFPPMTPLQYVDQMRLLSRDEQEKDVHGYFTPTELQRRIPHDIRIDVIPGEVMRDQLILFQDFYDANELFKFLMNSAMFLGGSPGNQDCWFVPPSFLRKYWFLCPNHKPTDRMDNNVEIVVYLGQRLQAMMLERKKMYMEREKYIDYFPPPTLFPSITLDSRKSSLEPGEEYSDEEEVDTFKKITDEVPLDIVMDVMEAMPRLTSPNRYPFAT